jgi:nucleoside-diphosphate-sugar epimerase
MEWGARFVLASSPEAYGDNEQMPLHHEDTSVFPSASTHQRFSYGASKYLDEVAMHHAVHQGLDARIVRPFNAYGADMLGDEYGQVVGMFFQAIRDQQPMTVHGDGTQTRSLTHIDDIVEGFYLAGYLDVGHDGTSLSGGSFNLGSQEEVSMLELAASVNQIVGTLAVDCVLAGGYPGDSKRRLPNIESSQSALGWSPTIMLDVGLEMVWEALQAGP